MNSKKRCIIVDIDETICTVKDKYKIDIPKTINREDWDNFLKKRDYYNPKQFKPIKNIIEIVEGLTKFNQDLFIFFVTARENIEGKPMYLNTYRLIRKCFKSLEEPKLLGRKYKIMMRKENDFRTNQEVKEEILHDILENFIPALAIDDEAENVDMFQKYGIPCLKVCKREDILK